MTMNDDFLHRIRVDPPQRFVRSLKARLNELETESLRRRWVGRRGIIIGALTAGAALATGFYVAQTTHSPLFGTLRTAPVAASSHVDDQQLGWAPKPTDSATTDAAVTSQRKAVDINRTLNPLGVGATVAIYPDIKVATSIMNRNMNVYPPFPEPTLTMMSSGTVFPSLCAGSTSIDAVVVDRRMLPEELEMCHRTHKHIGEVKLGYEAIALVSSKLYEAPKLSTRAIFLALAREVPDSLHPEELIKNPNLTWDQVDSTLPNERIDVSGPPLSTATGIAFRDLLMKAGCSALPTIASLKETDPERVETVCGSVRTDGVYRERELFRRDRNNLFDLAFDLVGYLQANPGAIALLGYREEMLRSLNLTAGSIDGVTPSPSIINAGSYAGSRSLYLYANTGFPHVREFVLAIWSSVGGGSGDTPLIAIDAAEQRALRQQVAALPDLTF
jgi:phosphate transport system substrate-binding protein